MCVRYVRAVCACGEEEEEGGGGRMLSVKVPGRQETFVTSHNTKMHF
jgi:hypothetical protein